ncbi:SDR family oxidoreductase [Actinoplanes rectilineatus]|uniref:SDR family oxidoreductase n=1 Tax=Actinoplanes rectilineatus TaxID=113571 RepID=UPI0005F2849E|nr:SDR family oxidoreductase [Actinoplanes rectilineatus]
MDEERIAIVTGASSGIGRATAARFARRGLRVVAAARRKDALDQLVAEAAGGPGTIVPVAADMTTPRAAGKLLEAAEREWGPAAVAVLAAGRGLPGTILGSDPLRWAEMIEVNYLSMLEQLRAFGSDFRQRETAAARDIVVIGSTAGRQVSAANPVYGSTKFAVHSLVEALRQEVCGDGVRVTLIEPGFVRSGFQDAAGYDMQWFAAVTEESGPLLVPDDVAATVEFVVDRPAHVHLDDIRLRPTRQRI